MFDDSKTTRFQLKVISLLLFTLALYSCNDSGSETPASTESGSIVGTWMTSSGSNKLIFYANGNFKYVENDPSAPAPQNGVETGTYSYNASSGIITFNITTDENDPGNGSGIGDIGTPAEIAAELSNSNNTLVLLGGIISFQRVSNVVGAWASTKDVSNGEGFNYLILYPDSTFIYAEHDILYNEPDNGVEAGTYTYDSASGNLTFNIIYDDNAPGNDSGIGNIGEPSVIDSTISEDFTKLTLLSGSFELNAIDFYDNLSIVGAWKSSNDITKGEGFNHMVFFPDGKFLYAEHDVAASSPENGLEVGTYSYDNSTGNITFDIIFDDNAPGLDSGVGNSGTPVTIDSTNSNEGTVLSILGGAITFNKKL